MNRSHVFARLLLAALAALLFGHPAPAHGQIRDFLTQIEADKVRDAEEPSQRIKLFLEFGADRLKKFRYELTRTTPDPRRADRLNALLEAYMGCIEDAAELIDIGREKQQDIRRGIKEMQSKGKEFLAYLEELAAGGPQLETYKETLLDAIEVTKEALSDTERAAKEYSPPPVRRRP